MGILLSPNLAVEITFFTQCSDVTFIAHLGFHSTNAIGWKILAIFNNITGSVLSPITSCDVHEVISWTVFNSNFWASRACFRSKY
jgi:hypothetical protein